MILMHGEVRIKDGRTAEMVAAARPMVEASRAEDGCNAYRYSFDLLDPQVMYFHEEWESQEALTAHFATPHLSEFGKAVGELVAGKLVIQKSTVTETVPFM